MKLIELVLVSIVGLVWALLIPFIAIPFMYSKERWAHWWRWFYCQGLAKIFGLKMKFIGLENWKEDTAYIIAPNHESIFDIVIMGSIRRPFRWVSKKSVQKIPCLGWAAGAIVYFVERNHSQSDVRVVMRAVEEKVREGNSVLMFPEGTRTRTGELLPFKKGPFRVAQNTGKCLLPVGIRGSFQIASKGRLPKGRGHEVEIHIGTPFQVPESMPLDDAFEKLAIELKQLTGRSR